ncbi:MAG: acyl-CoA dehydratase activase-related protein, partial [Thermodesulfobacteriota bacterium]|nr:acyl-CoA dehydratase activase-related protein [Thermodesulfobacteriota bacterium]
INTDLRNALQQGASREDVIAGLVYSIADNYTSRIVGARHLGEPLLFLGGVALNKAVALAMAARTQRKVIVPPHPELMGSVGTALMLRDHLRSGYISEREYDLHQLIQGEMELKDTFRCKACENNCEIQRIAIRGKVYPFGGLCSKYEILRHRGDETKEGRDMVALRNNMMINEFGPQPVKNPRGTIGLPMALTTFELFPFYTKLINELGYDVVTSSPSKVGNSKAIAAICYPCEVVHGAVYDLMNRNVDYIFLPSVIELEVPEGSLRSFTCPSTTVIADVIRAAFRDITNKILSPHISLSKDHIKTTLQEIERMGTTLGLHKGVARKAGEKALSHYEEYIKKYRELGEKEFEELIKEPTVIIVGRPYNTCSAEVNLALPRKITSKGYSVISADMLPHTNHNIHERDVWHFTQQISNAVGYAKKYPNLYICLVSCFSCGPDASMYHWIRQELEGRTFCYLEIDSHTAHAGFETRVGAFLDIVEERRRKKEDLNLN